MKFKSKAISVLAMLIAARLAFAETEFRQEPPKEVIVEQRDLNFYADGGEFTSGPGKEVSNIAELRQFVWRHWNEKTRAYVRLSMSGKDSTGLTYFFIESDQTGAWRIACRQMNVGYPCPTCHRWFLRDTLYATSVQWSARRDGKKLVLKDGRGKKIL